MNRLLNMRVDRDHLGIKLRVISDQNLGIPRSSNEDSVDTTAKRCGEDISNLEPDKECKSNNDGRVASISVVCRISENEIKVC